ncbi:lag1 longevity assurance [Stylonychia lemnae]|uniref:Lag1 longevity assurance n=1 Tax=Stylonychia lemnae TaxID=5949 RepID=A0A078AII0_STYLE|nr:lag1 longevity assurance [Stylonychia lemnae]|eukprot:CDW81302.1 lag1 longevity assurance [Stylonychia lemnae]
MSSKNYLFYPLILTTTTWTINHGLNLSSYNKYLKTLYPECMESNENRNVIVMMSFLILLIIQHPVEEAARQAFFNYLLPAKKFPKNSIERAEKAQMLSERVHKLIVYTTTTCLLYGILWNSPYLSKYLLGSSEDPQLFMNYPCQPLPKYLDDFYLLKLAYHAYELFYSMIYHRGRLDFPEYVFHHIVTLALIVKSYSINYLPIGAIIMLLHDLSDIFLSIFKLCCDVLPMKIQMTSYFIMLTSWIYLRMWFFPVNVIYAYILQVQDSKDYVILENYWILLYFVICLYVLHIFWFYLMIRGLIKRIRDFDSVIFKNSENK